MKHNWKPKNKKINKKRNKKSHTAQTSCHLLSNNKWTKERIRFMQCKRWGLDYARIHLLRKDYVSGESLRASFVRTKHTASSKNGVLGRCKRGDPGGSGAPRWLEPLPRGSHSTVWLHPMCWINALCRFQFGRFSSGWAEGLRARAGWAPTSSS